MAYQPKDVFGRDFPLEHALSCVGKGWWNLVKECYQLCVENEVDIHQIKEKFGGLRFYTGPTRNRKFFDQIEEICERSYTICENCGQPGEPDTNRGWIKTLCPNCTKVEMEFSHELEHLLSDEQYNKWQEDIKSGKVARTLNNFIDALKSKLEEN